MLDKEEIAVSSGEMAVIAIRVVGRRQSLEIIHYYDPAVKLLTAGAVILQPNTKLQSMCWSLTPTPRAGVTIKHRITIKCEFPYQPTYF